MKRFIRFSLVLLLFMTSVVLCACNRTDSDAIPTECRSTEYILSLTAMEGLKEILISEEVKINNLEYEMREAVFRIYPEAYREGAEPSAYFESMHKEWLRYGGIDITNVKVDGRDVAYTVEDTVLTVPLPSPVDAGGCLSVKLGARLTLPSGTLRLGSDGRVARLANFYPILARYPLGVPDTAAYSRIGDPFSSDSADYKVTVYAPKSVTVATSGRQISDGDEGNSHVVKAELDRGGDFAVVLYEGCERETAELDGVTFDYYYRKGNSSSMDALITAAATFVKLFGAFPYASFTVAESPFYYGGMEYPGLALVNENALDKEEIIVHELLHQWIGCAVGSDGATEPWVDESLVSFLTAYYYRLKGDEDAYIAARALQDKQFDAFYLTEKVSSPGYIPRIDRSVYEFYCLYEYDSIVYKRGAAMYAAMLDLYGDRKFCKALRDYYERYAYRNATGEELMASFERSLGSKAYPIFRSYLNADVRSGLWSSVARWRQ